MWLRSRTYEPENGADEPTVRDVEQVLDEQELDRPDVREPETETLMTVRDLSLDASFAEASQCGFAAASSAQGSTARSSVRSRPSSLSPGPQSDTSPPRQTIPEHLQPAAPPDRDERVFVVLCPPDGGWWSKFTCLLAFAAAFVCDGVCLSLFLFDVRVGMADRVPSRTHTLEHVAVICLSRYLIEPFACAFINCYGFRYCLFVGSVLCVTWLAPIYFFGSAHVFEHCQILAAVGGIGMGMIKMSFFVLLSTLFVMNRQKAHLVLQMGSFAGMLLVPPFTEFLILMVGWQNAVFFHLALTCCMLALWLLVVTPVPLKINVIDRDPLTENSFHRSKTNMQPKTGRNAEISSENTRFPTILTTIGLRPFSRLRMVTFTETTPVGSAASAKNLYWMHEESDNRKICVRNVVNMCGARLIGSRPMYRDDALFDGDVRLLAADLKLNEYAEYLMAMTRISSVDDLNEEKRNRCRIFPIAMSRVLKSMFRLKIWCRPIFSVLAFSEVLVQASSFLPFVFVKGPPGSRSSAESMLILVAGCAGLLVGRGVGFVFHESASTGAVPLYHVGLVLMASGLSLLLCAGTDSFCAMIPYFAIFGSLFGYYTSMRNATTYAIFPLAQYNNARGYISIVRALSSFAGIKIATTIQIDDPTGNGDVYVFAGTLMLVGGVCAALLHLFTAAKRATAERGFGRHRHAVTI